MASDAIALSAPGGKASSTASLTHAALEVYEAMPAEGGSKPGASVDRIPFQFNPKELSISKTAKWERKTARGAKTAGPPEFTGADPCKLTLELFFDATDTMDGKVVSLVDQLFQCLVPTDDSLGKKKASPPLVVLQWGKVKSFAGFVTSVQAKYTLFTSQGTPIRATCSVSIEEMPGNPPKQNPTSGGLALTSVRTVVAGDSLASIAYKEYGDPTMWRPLAAFNGIDDPLRLRLGTALLLPVVDDLLADHLMAGV
jgi:nucleoid-associated protein YgaU